MEKKVLMTSHERKIAERNSRFINQYKHMKSEFGNVSNWRIIQAIAQQENTSGQTVRKVLLDKGIISKRIR
jgi:hypothetical protein|nr:MAG TPA: periplasmic binding protein [Caudoviricetes sp.]DAL65433.1 MAG TPA_asm: periplasmic binding protein [Caudoviricetes sp.]